MQFPLIGNAVAACVLAMALMANQRMQTAGGFEFSLGILRNSVHLDGPGSAGSAFYVASPEALWLVTAKHVLIPKNGPPLPFFTASSQHNDPAEPGLARLKVSLTVGGAPHWFGTASDVAVVLISRVANGQYQRMQGVEEVPPGSKSGVVATPLADLRTYAQATIGNDVFLVGYPISLGLAKQFDPYAPLLRRGVLAGKNESNHTLILDVPSFPGNSGGPVFQQRFENGKPLLLPVAVMSEFVPYVRTFEGNGLALALSENSGLSVGASLDEALTIFGASLGAQK